LLALRRDLDVRELRGNVGTRLRRLDEGDFDALILAAAGLQRLEFQDRIRELLPTERMLPAIGQGALGIECRGGDRDVRALIEALNDLETARCVTAERAVNRTLFGGCHVPIAGFARIDSMVLELDALVGTPDGRRLLRGRRTGDPADAERIGRELGEQLLDQGAGEILSAIAHG
jgi:hydroxymethylbilane synthase